MTDLPIKRTRTVEYTEWVIPTPCDAKTYALGHLSIHRDMRESGVDTSKDDAFSVNATEEGIVFTVRRAMRKKVKS